MTVESILGIDIGTSSTKAVLARSDGTLIAQAHRDHSLSLPQLTWAEHDAEGIWWRDVLAVCSELAPLAGNGLRGICISGIGPCVVLCDAQVRPLRPAILYGIDARATAEIQEIEQIFGAPAILERAGSALSSQALGPKLLWLRRHEPDAWAYAAGWYMASSFIAARLTGAYVLDHHSASQCDPLYDLRAGNWAEDWAEEIAPGIRLPDLVWPSDTIGTVTAAAARETGLPQGTPVVAGTIDAWAEAFSAGVRQPGDLMLMYGSTMFLVHINETARPHPLLWSTQAAERGVRSVAAGMSTAGILAEWVRELVGNPHWEDLLSEASATPPGCHGLLLLPYFSGERTPIYDPCAHGVIARLTLDHRRSHLLRATYEATAFGVRQIFNLLTEAVGRPRRVVAVGGGTQADLWLQIVTDVTGVQQQVPEQTLGAAYGDALLAAIGSDLVPSTTDWAKISHVVCPDQTSSAIYDELFDLYGDLYVGTADLVHRLACLDFTHMPPDTSSIRDRNPEQPDQNGRQTTLA